MVTLKRLPGLADFSRITDAAEPPLDAHGKPCHLVANAITRAFERTIRHFHEQWWGLWPLECFAIMPDHIHLLFRLRDTGDQLPLGKYVYHLMKALAEDYWRQTGLPSQNASLAAPVPSGAHPPPVFERKWHDWIVKKDGQLAAFRRYIEENPARSWLRRQNARFFGTVRTVSFCGSEWFAYGNAAILDLPVLAAIRGHRATRPGSSEWENLVGVCARLGPGGAGVGTFMSPLEKACGNAIAKAGGKWVVLSPEGFSPRWHPHRQQERFCAEGRMLFLSLYEATERRLSNKDLHHRCHVMRDIVVAGLGEPPKGRRTQDGGRQAECGGGVREGGKKMGGGGGLGLTGGGEEGRVRVFSVAGDGDGGSFTRPGAGPESEPRRGRRDVSPIARWCNGSTRPFGGQSRGSNPRRATMLGGRGRA